jgi:hypothetical protein
MRILTLIHYTTRPPGWEAIYTQNTLHPPYINLSILLVITMGKRFSIGFGPLAFLTINFLMAHLSSGCGLPAVFGRDAPWHRPLLLHHSSKQRDCAQINCLCYNAVTMPYGPRFANNNNNDNDDNSRIVGRSFAG